MKPLKLIIVQIIAILFLSFASCNTKTQTEMATLEAVSTVDTVNAVLPDKEIVTPVTSGDNCIVASAIKLPYAKTIDRKKANYKKLNCKIKGIEEFICDPSDARYISLPDFENIKVILVPMDCGDFSYRYYLLTIFENKMVSNRYVEGEWHEPGSDDYKEITSFSIDSDYVITITTNAVENGATRLKETAKITIRDDGNFDKVN